MLKTLTLLGMMLFLLTFSAFAQKSLQMDYGSYADLKGVKKIYLDTGSNSDLHNYFLREITKAKLPMEITETPAPTDLVLYYRVVAPGGVADGFKYPINVMTSNVVKGMVFLPKAADKIQVIFDYEEPPNLKDDKLPAKAFLASFIKAYKDTNGLK